MQNDNPPLQQSSHFKIYFILFPRWYENKTLYQAGNGHLLCMSCSQIWDTYQHWRNSVSTEDNNLHKGLWDRNWDMGLGTGLSAWKWIFQDPLPKICPKQCSKAISKTIDLVLSPAEESEFLFFSHDSISVKASTWTSECNIHYSPYLVSILQVLVLTLISQLFFSRILQHFPNMILQYNILIRQYFSRTDFCMTSPVLQRHFQVKLSF